MKLNLKTNVALVAGALAALASGPLGLTQGTPSLAAAPAPTVPTVKWSSEIGPDFYQMLVDAPAHLVLASTEAPGTLQELSFSGHIEKTVIIKGASGMALDGSLLYVASAKGIAEVNVNSGTLSGPLDPKSYLVGSPLVLTGGALWTVPQQQGGAGLVRISLGGGAPNSYGGVLAPARGEATTLVGDPWSGTALFTYAGTASGTAPVQVDEISLSGVRPLVTARATVPGCTEVGQASWSPGGRSLIFPCTSLGKFVSMSVPGFKPSTTYEAKLPTAVAMSSSNGGVFAGTVYDIPPTYNLVINSLGHPAHVVERYWLESLYGGKAPVDAVSMAFSPSGHQLFVVAVPRGALDIPDQFYVVDLPGLARPKDK